MPLLNERRARALVRPLLVLLALLTLLNLNHLTLAFRDVGYLLRPIWDTPQAPFVVIPHFARPATSSLPPSSSPSSSPPPSSSTLSPSPPSAEWCALHGWAARPAGSKPVLVDAVPLSTELDLLEIRMREFAGLVDTLVVVEANATFAGSSKPLHLAQSRARFDELASELGIKLVYGLVDNFVPVDKGSMENEHRQRRAISALLSNLALPAGSLVLMSDVDEIVSRPTVELLLECDVPEMHLGMASFMYSFDQPRGSTWRPRVYVVGEGGAVAYSHGRGADKLLADAGWHCSFCLRTLEDMRAKMAGYGHNDRLTSSSLLDEEALRRRVCTGEDPFDMFPEAWSFKEIVAQSGGIERLHSFDDVPLALKQEPDRWRYLLDQGCERPNA